MTNSEIVMKCLDGIDALRARQKVISKEHSERIKGFIKLQTQVRHSSTTGQLELAGTGGVDLSPEMENLLENPTLGL